jgi:hypothetical protein
LGKTLFLAFVVSKKWLMIPTMDCFVGRKENRDYFGGGENRGNETASKYTINKRYTNIR